MKVVVESWAKSFNHLKPSIRKTAAELGRFLGQKDCYIEIYLVGESFMEKNVLAFPAPKSFPRPDIQEKPLGEIYLNPKYIKEHGESLIYMLVHGFLHLLGYDHEKKGDRIRMERKERELLQKL